MRVCAILSVCRIKPASESCLIICRGSQPSIPLSLDSACAVRTGWVLRQSQHCQVSSNGKDCGWSIFLLARFAAEANTRSSYLPVTARSHFRGQTSSLNETCQHLEQPPFAVPLSRDR
jgi:hypothetical protein